MFLYCTDLNRNFENVSNVSSEKPISISVILSSLATIIFPIGFSVPDIGGAAYQLPNSYEVRKSSWREALLRVDAWLMATRTLVLRLFRP